LTAARWSKVTSIVADGPVAAEPLGKDSMASIIGISASRLNPFVALDAI